MFVHLDQRLDTCWCFDLSVVALVLIIQVAPRVPSRRARRSRLVLTLRLPTAAHGVHAHKHPHIYRGQPPHLINAMQGPHQWSIASSHTHRACPPNSGCLPCQTTRPPWHAADDIHTVACTQHAIRLHPCFHTSTPVRPCFWTALVQHKRAPCPQFPAPTSSRPHPGPCPHPRPHSPTHPSLLCRR